MSRDCDVCGVVTMGYMMTSHRPYGLVTNLLECSGGFRGSAGYAAAYPIDWTGCIFVTFKVVMFLSSCLFLNFFLYIEVFACYES